jgi:hypothetical protein
MTLTIRVRHLRPTSLPSIASNSVRWAVREKEDRARTDAQRNRVQARYAKKVGKAEKKVETARGKLQRAEAALGKARTQDTLAAKGRTWNLGTSLKSYIAPRVFYRWGQQVEYDVLGLYYPKTLQRKFAWVSEQEQIDFSI